MPIFPSLMLHPPNDAAPHLRPVNTRVQLLVEQPADRDILPADQVQAVLDFRARLRVVGGADDALDRVLEDEVGELVAGEEGAGQGAAVGGEDEDFFCGLGEMWLADGT